MYIAAVFVSLLSLANAYLPGAHGRLGDMARDRLTRHAELMDSFDRGLESRSDTSSFRFLNPKSKQYRIKSLPLVHYDLGEIYSGNIPIEDDPSRNLFFVFQPKHTGDPVDEVTIWLNGGPGCSSLEGFLQENGLYQWAWGMYRPQLNAYAWSNLTNMLWVEYPVGVGFSQGKVMATNEEEIAKEFVTWFKNFSKVFGIKHFKIYVTGESYAGRYVPYIAGEMLEQNNTKYFDLGGILVYDPCIGSFDYQNEITVVPFVKANQNLFNLNSTFLADVEHRHQTCGYQKYLDQYLTYPASGVQPPLVFNFEKMADCELDYRITDASYALNPCFNPYDITGTCPLLWDSLGFPTSLEYSPPGWTPYFNRQDVKKAMHAPLDVTWSECANKTVFKGDGGPEQRGDSSLDPIQQVLPRVIEATNRVLVSNGDYDMAIITNATLLAIQNMTWHGKLGFQSVPSEEINIKIPDLQYNMVFEDYGYGGYDGPQGVMGKQHFERGLMWAQTYQSGHMQPQFQGRVSYRHLQWVLGRVQRL